jgi:hypothetical protein
MELHRRSETQLTRVNNTTDKFKYFIVDTAIPTTFANEKKKKKGVHSFVEFETYTYKGIILI